MHKQINRVHGNNKPASSSVQAKNRRKIYVAIATHSKECELEFLQSMMRLMKNSIDCSLSFGWSSDPSIDRARNVLTANFLKTDCTHLLFIDSDIVFNPANVDRITSHNADVVSGLYPIKTMDERVKWVGEGFKCRTFPNLDGVQHVKSVGHGFLSIRRGVIEKMIKAYGKKNVYIQAWPPHRCEYAIWSESIVAKRFLTSDFNFCHLWQRLGGMVHCDTKVILRHVGSAVWPLDLQQGNPFIMDKAA